MPANLLNIKLIPKASQNKVEHIDENSLKVYVIACPVQGKANKALIEVLAKHFNIAKSLITIEKGHKSKEKVIRIESR